MVNGMAGAKSFRELKVYVAARDAAKRVFAVSEHFPREERYALTDQIRRSSRAVDDRYQAISGMLSRMIDRADDFCKHAPATDYRSVGRVEEESLFTDH